MLSTRQRRFLRASAHSLKPVVRVGSRGLSASVNAEIEAALNAHELMKIKLDCADRQRRDALVRQACDDSGAQLVQRIGKTAVLYRAHPERPRLALPE